MAVPEMIKYRREFVAAFNVGVSLLKNRGLEESMSMGRSAVFDVTAVGGRMQKRSIDGRIPRTNVSDTQVTVTLEEYVKKFEVTDFEKFTSQSDERAKMNHRIMESVNQELDYVILNELANASTSYASGAAQTMTQAIATKVIAQLARGAVPINPSDLTWVITPDMHAKLLNMAGYTSADFVNSKPLAGDTGQYDGTQKIRSWLDIGWVVHTNLPGVGTSTATNYQFHLRALGVAAPDSQIKYSAGYDDQDHFHYASATVKAGAKLLQQAGVLKVVHDDTAA